MITFDAKKWWHGCVKQAETLRGEDNRYAIFSQWDDEGQFEEIGKALEKERHGEFAEAQQHAGAGVQIQGDPAPLSDYECERLDNIRANRAQVRELQRAAGMDVPDEEEPPPYMLLGFNENCSSDCARVKAFCELFGEVQTVAKSQATSRRHVPANFASSRFWCGDGARAPAAILDYFWFQAHWWTEAYGGDSQLAAGTGRAPLRSWFGPGGYLDIYFAHHGRLALLPDDAEGEVRAELEAYGGRARFQVEEVEPGDNPLMQATLRAEELYMKEYSARDRQKTHTQNLRYLDSGAKYFAVSPRPE